VNDLKNSTPRGVNDYEKISSEGVKGSENRQLAGVIDIPAVIFGCFPPPL
jgi:hypothetical protein